MRAIKIKTRQTTAHFKKKLMYVMQETYPLPPHSTVVGFIHKLAQYDTYHDMQISVQGEYRSKTVDFATQHYNGSSGIISGPASIELLVDLRCTLHVVPADQDEIDHIYQSLVNPCIYPSLGRHEDLVEIESVEIVNLYMTQFDEEANGSTGAYVPQDLIYENDDDDGVIQRQNQDYSGTSWELNKVFKIEHERRVWVEKANVVYLRNFDILNDEDVFVDETHQPVFLV